MKKQQENDKKATDLKRLKDLFPQTQQRQAYAMKKLGACKLKNPAIVRIQPLNFKMSLPVHFTTLMLDKSQKMGIIISILSTKLKIDSKSPLFCFIGNKKLVQISKQVGQVYQQCKQEDAILYIYYTDHPGFGYQYQILEQNVIN